jgi:hypothetical protein
MTEPSNRLIADEIDLGPVVIARMKRWGIETLGDLTEIGAFTEYGSTNPKWSYCTPALMGVKGFGRVRLLRVRLALREYDLALKDEAEVNQHQNLEIYAPPDDGA